MQVPTSQQVVAGQGRLSYVQGSAPNLGANVARSLQGLGANLVALAERTKQRNDKIDEFKTIQNYSAWETEFAKSLEEYKRNAPPDAKGYSEGVANLYDTQSQTFISTVPKDLQEEWKARIAQSKTKLVTGALAFQYEQGDNFFKLGINDEYQKSLGLVGNDPNAAEQEIARVGALVDAADLAENEKYEMKRNVALGIYSLQYKDQVKKQIALTANIPDLPDDDMGAASALVKSEEGGFIETARADYNATTGKFAHWMVGYSSNTITEADGTVRRVKEGDKITIEDAERDFARRMKEGAAVWKEWVGEEQWGSLNSAQKAALTSLHYHYGANKDAFHGIIGALKQGDIAKAGANIAALGVNPQRRAREAAVFLGQKSIDMDPRFSNIPYNERQQMQQQAQTEVSKEITAENVQRKQVYESNYQSLLMGTTTGQTTEQTVRDFRRSNPTMTYDEFDKAMGAVKKYQGETSAAANFSQALRDPDYVFSGGAEQQKQMNAFMKQYGGPAAVIAGNPDAWAALQLVTGRTSAVPSEMVGALNAGILSRNRDMAAKSFQILSNLNQAYPSIFARDFDNETARLVGAFEHNLGKLPAGADPAQAVDETIGISPQAQKLRREAMEKAESIYENVTKGKMFGDELFAKLITDLDPRGMLDFMTSAPSAPEYAPMRQSMQEDFKTAFIANYANVQDETAAYEMAMAEMKRVYGVSEIDGRSTLMKYPPEKAGPTANRPINGSFDYLTEQLRADFGVGEDTEIMIMDDYQTGIDLKNKGFPTYQVLTKGPGDSHWKLATKTGQRYYFQIPEEAVKAEIENSKRKNTLSIAEEKLLEFERKYSVTPGQPMAAPKSIDPDELEDYIRTKQSVETIYQQRTDRATRIQAYKTKYESPWMADPKASNRWVPKPFQPSEAERQQYLKDLKDEKLDNY